MDQYEQFKSKSYVSNLVQEKLMFPEEKTLMNWLFLLIKANDDSGLDAL